MRVKTWVRVVILFGVRVRVVFRVRAWVRLLNYLWDWSGRLVLELEHGLPARLVILFGNWSSGVTFQLGTPRQKIKPKIAPLGS